MSKQTFTFEQTGDFAACAAAEAWCRENGYSVGAMQRNDPRGLLKGNFLISKWRNMTEAEKRQLDGIMTGNMRGGPVAVGVWWGRVGDGRVGD